MAAARLQQPQQRLIADAAVAGVDGTVYLDEVGANLVHCPRNCDNIEAIGDDINHAMLQATWMISLPLPVLPPLHPVSTQPMSSCPFMPIWQVEGRPIGRMRCFVMRG